MGVALETTRFAEQELERGDLVVLDGKAFERIARFTHFICYRKSAVDNQRLMAFCAWIHAQLAQPMPPTQPTPGLRSAA